MIFLISVSDHGIHGVDRLVGHGSCCPAKHHVEQRRDHAVRRIFRHCLHGRADNAFLIQYCCVAAHDHGYCVAGSLNVLARRGRRPVLHKGTVDFHGCVLQAPGCQRITAEDGFQRYARQRVHCVCSHEQAPRDLGHNGENEYGRRAALDPLDRRGITVQAQELFQRRDQAPDPADGMGHPLRIPDQAVQTRPDHYTDHSAQEHFISDHENSLSVSHHAPSRLV